MHTDRSNSGGVRLGWVALVAVVLVACTVWLGLPRYRHWKEVRFRDKAREFLQKTNLAAAWLSGQQALVLNPTNVETLRLLAETAERGRQPQAIALRRKIAELEPGNITNRLLWAQTALEFEPPPCAEATKALEGIPETNRRTPDFHTIAAGLELRRGNVAKAESHFQTVIELSPTNRQAQINLAVLRLRSPEEPKRAAAQQMLEQMRTDSAARVSVLRSLVAFCRQTSQHEKALSFSNEMLAEKDATLDDQLSHLEILRGTGERGTDAFNAHLEKVQKQLAGRPDDVARLAAWMQGSQLSERALAWIETLPKEIQEQLPVPMAVADLYASQKKWREMEDYLRDRSWSEQEPARHAMVALALRSQGDRESSVARWNRAVRAANDQVHLLRGLAQLASAWEWRQEAEQVLEAIVDRHPDESWAFQVLAQQYMIAGNTAGLKKVFSRMAQKDPKDFVARNNLAVANLLLNDEVPRAHELAKEVYEHDKTNPGFVATYAYSLHVQGRSTEALALLDLLDPRHLANPSTAVYHGLILAALGQKDRALAPLEMGAKSSLLPEERRLAEEALRKLRG
jgi:tetratricopeptide (TPR) repeat protein